MENYGVAYNSRNHDINEPLGLYAISECNMTTLEFAKIIAKNRIRDGFKDVTVFKYNGAPPYDKVMTHYVSWNFVMNNKIE